MKFAIRIEEVIGKTVIVEAEDLEEAIEKVENAANNGEFMLDDIENFVSREVKPSDVFENGIVLGNRDVSYYEHIGNDKPDKSRYEAIEDILVEKISNDTIANIEDFLGYPISAEIMEGLDDRIREVLNQMPEEELLIYEQKYLK